MKTIFKKSILWWLPLPVIGTLNGMLRGFLLNRFFAELVARQLSSVLMIIWIFLYIWIIHEKLDIEKLAQAWVTGVTWFFLTVAFEFGLGYISGLSLEAMLADYNLAAGRLWVLVLVALLVGPVLLYFRSRLIAARGPVE